MQTATQRMLLGQRSYKMYKLIKNLRGEIAGACKEENGFMLSFTFADPDNTDYQQYLKWVAEGNEPLPADEGDA